MANLRLEDPTIWDEGEVNRTRVIKLMNILNSFILGLFRVKMFFECRQMTLLGELDS